MWALYGDTTPDAAWIRPENESSPPSIPVNDWTSPRMNETALPIALEISVACAVIVSDRFVKNAVICGPTIVNSVTPRPVSAFWKRLPSRCAVSAMFRWDSEMMSPWAWRSSVIVFACSSVSFR